MTDTDPHVALAGALRRLLDVAVRLRGDHPSIAAAAGRLSAAAADLEHLLPATPPPRYPSGQAGIEEIFRYDFVMGDLNPVAVPVCFRNEGTTAVGYATFGNVYEGPPGCVHGAVLAGVFDQVLNIANMLNGTPGPTVRLELDFRKPTPLHREIRFEARCDKIENRRIHTSARCLYGDTVTVEASGTFAEIDLAKLSRLGEQ
jgi:hypothetical protein